MIAALATQGLSKKFGALQVAREIDFTLPVGARHALIGPNGAGKTTFINLLTGAIEPDSGRVTLGETDITYAATHRRVRMGLVRTFQINSLFPDFTPLEAVTMTICEREGIAGRWLSSLTGHRALAEEAYALLEKLGLGDEATRMTRYLPYGRQRLLEIGIALAAKPRVLLLDEPAAGVPERESHELLEAISALPADIAIMFIEHDMELVFRFANRITVLVAGQVLCEGAPAEIAADARVREVYLGSRDHG
ncbi:MAG TPA: ABC transporter ATP-binding protein [Magnetospirillaceae bacterium]|jgi:ABC-type branched-subunit amino acid transport system ATPase component